MQPTPAGSGARGARGAAVGRRVARAARGARGRIAVPWRGGCARGGCTAFIAGVYAVGHRRLAWRGHMVAAVLACGDGAVAEPSERRASVGPARPRCRRSDRRERPAGPAAERPASGCTAHAPSMPRTPPTTTASRSRRSPARCSTSRRLRSRATSIARSPRPSGFASTTTQPSRRRSSARTGITAARGSRGQPRKSPPSPAASSNSASSSSSNGRPCHDPTSTPPSMPSTTDASRSTSTGRRTTSSWRPTAKRPTERGRRSKPTAEEMRRWQQKAIVSCASPGPM